MPFHKRLLKIPVSSQTRVKSLIILNTRRKYSFSHNQNEPSCRCSPTDVRGVPRETLGGGSPQLAAPRSRADPARHHPRSELSSVAAHPSSQTGRHRPSPSGGIPDCRRSRGGDVRRTVGASGRLGSAPPLGHSAPNNQSGCFISTSFP